MNNIKRPTISEQVTELIVQYIQEHNLETGDQIPTEKELASLFQVSRTSVREATKALSFNGVLKAIPGKGTFLAEQNTSLPDDRTSFIMAQNTIYEVMEVRNALIVKATELAAHRRTEEDAAYLRECAENYEHCAQAGTDYIMWSKRFFSRIIDATHNPLLSSTLQPLERIVDRYRQNLAANHIAETEYTGSMKRISKYIADQDSYRAVMEMSWHVELSMQSLLQLLNNKNADSFLP